MVISLLLILVTFAFLLRRFTFSFSKGWFSKGFAGDSSVHLSIIYQLKQKDSSRRISNYVIPNRMSYPILFHQICSFFSENIIINKSHMPNLLLHLISVGFFYIYLYFISLYHFPYLCNEIPFVATLIYILSILNLTTNGPAIAYLKLSSRLLGRVSCSMFMFSLIIYNNQSDNLIFYLIIIFGIICFLSSTFAAQALLFIVPIYSLLTLDYLPVLIVLISLVLSFLFNRGHSYVSVTSMIKYWFIYNKYVKHSRYQKSSLSNYLNFKILFNYISKYDFKNLILLFLKREPTRLILYFPELTLLLYLSCDYTHDLLVSKSLFMLISVLVIYALTTTKYFNFLGESYRYLEYSLSFIFPFIITYTIFKYYELNFILNLILILLIFNILVSYLTNKYFGFNKKNKDTLSSFINLLEIDKNDVIFPVTMRLGADIVARCNCKSFWWQPGAITDDKMYEEYIEEYPYLSVNWKHLCEKHKVTKIIADKSALSQFHLDYNFKSLGVLLEDEHYIAYRYNCI